MTHTNTENEQIHDVDYNYFYFVEILFHIFTIDEKIVIVIYCVNLERLAVSLLLNIEITIRVTSQPVHR